MYIFHEDGTLPPDGSWVFVFGSNLAGQHGAGAAKVALQNYGAKYGIGHGLVGKSYAIPTKDQFLNTRLLGDIEREIDRFVEFSHENDHLLFWVAAVGCGLAKHKHSSIAPMFKEVRTNCNLPDAWKPYVV